jgi:phosphoglycerate dehydrogenase-like enzyme
VQVLLCNDSYPKAIERLGALLPEHRIVSCAPTKVADHLDGIDVLIPSVAKISAEIIERGTFGLIQQFGVGLDPVDIDAATKCGVWVARVPGAGSGNTESVAELAVMFMLTLARRLYEAKDNIQKGIFFKPSGWSLLGKTVCIMGFGDIGQALAERLVPFGMHIKAVRKNAGKGAPEHLKMVKVFGMDNLANALADSDFVVLALPENKETESIINSKTIAMVKRGSYIINVGRGGLIAEAPLLDALQTGQIAGCGFDVFWREPMDPNDPIFKYNVVATPHVGGNTDASFTGITNAIADNVKRYAKGEVPLHIVNDPKTIRSRKV